MADKLFELRRRTFDTPHFRGIEFIEVEAKSILNRVPGNYLPFNWTINPYRGCSHACSYCLSGDTPILMADGSQKPLSDLSVGDRLIGTQKGPNYRRYVETEVLDHWSTAKTAYEIVLQDGTRLVASGDHRFLTDRGWKHVTGSEQGSDRRPHLTLNSKMLGFGSTWEPAKETQEYRRGYLSGMIRGDGHVGSYSYNREGRSHGDVYRFRLALADFEGLWRTKSYLQSEGIETTEFHFSAETEVRREIRALRTSARSAVEKIQTLIRCPDRPTEDWRKGFLAGIFDAEGGRSRGILRITNADHALVWQIAESLSHFGFTFSAEPKERAGRVPIYSLRLVGGLKEHLRFIHLVGPAIRRKCRISGSAIKSDAPLQVKSIRDLGVVIPMFDITTGTGDFVANGIVSHNCFARATHTYMDMNAGRDFETKIVVKVNAPELLTRGLRRKSWKGETVAMGTATDPYQRAEGKYKIMPRIISTLTEFRNPFSILTKGTLILRDLELLAEAARLTDVSTAFSIGTLDEEVWRRSEPGTPHPRRRVEAVARLNEAGIPCGVLVAPLLPGISDSDRQMHEVIEACLGAGATHVSPILLHLRPHVKEVYMEWLATNYPDLVPRYLDMYTGAYASKRERDRLGMRFGAIRTALGGSPGSHRRPARRKPPARRSNEQMSLL